MIALSFGGPILFGLGSKAGKQQLESKPAEQAIVAKVEDSGLAGEVADESFSGEVDEEEPLEAVQILYQAFQHFRQNQDALAVKYFWQAIASNDLNDAGLVLAYWYIFICERSLNHLSVSNNALVSFLVVAQDILDNAAAAKQSLNAVNGEMDLSLAAASNPEVASLQREPQQPKLTLKKHAISPRPLEVDYREEFITRFALPKRIAEAKALLSASWWQKSQLFGRTSLQPIPVSSQSELQFFLDLMPACQQVNRRHLELPTVATGSVPTGVIEDPERFLLHRFKSFTISCASPETGLVNYYFEVH